MLDGQTYMRNDGSMGIYRIKKIDNPKNFNEIKYNFNEIKRNHVEVYSCIDRFQLLRDKELIFDSEIFFDQWTFVNKKIKEFETANHYLYRVIAIYHLCLEDNLPFRFYVKSRQGGLSYSINKSFKYIDFDNIKIRWEIFMNDTKILNKIIKFNSELERIIIWYTLGTMSETNLERFMCYYRCFESFGRKYFGPRERRFNYAISFLEGVERLEPEKVRQLRIIRNSIAHGNDIGLEFNLEVTNFKEYLKETAYNLISNELKKFNNTKLINPRFERQYYSILNNSTGELNIVEGEFESIFRNEFSFPHKIKILGAWTKEDEVIALKNVTNKAMKKDIKHYLSLKKIGKYSDSGITIEKK